MMEVFSKDQLQYNSGGPKDAALLYSLDDAADDFSGMHITHQEQVMITLHEGPFHSGPASVVRLIAKK